MSRIKKLIEEDWEKVHETDMMYLYEDFEIKELKPAVIEVIDLRKKKKKDENEHSFSTI